ncbi:MAG: hypothetical protein D6773_07815 [Alphaproteobacteria bacterium]|nr:MAG: hypothetical protein D6773_07815 [Alphaproteobacteria bacterium]
MIPFPARGRVSDDNAIGAFAHDACRFIRSASAKVRGMTPDLKGFQLRCAMYDPDAYFGVRLASARVLSQMPDAQDRQDGREMLAILYDPAARAAYDAQVRQEMAEFARGPDGAA